MKLNENTALLSSKILLVPYDPHHVPTYHQWMEDPHLRAATASEGLTLEEEYSMQRSWREDADKLTFIAAIPPHFGDTPDAIIAGVDDPPSSMIGDVNLFFFDGTGSDEEDEEDDEDEDEELDDIDEDTEIESSRGGSISPNTIPGRQITGEVELMIARSENQGKGLGKATLLLFLAYVLRNRETVVAGLPIPNHQPPSPTITGVQTPPTSQADLPPPILANLRVKIGQNNIRSLGLFESIGFVKKTGKPNYFGEFEMVVDRPLDEYREHVERLLEEYGMGGWRELRYVRK